MHILRSFFEGAANKQILELQFLLENDWRLPELNPWPSAKSDQHMTMCFW